MDVAAASYFGVSTNVRGLHVSSEANGTSATNQYGIHTSVTSAGTVTNRYGIMIDMPLGSATNDWAFFSKASQPSYFAGNLGIGTSSPNNPLHVVGSATNSASIYGVTKAAVGGAGVQGDNSATGARGLLGWNNWGVYCFSGNCGGSTGAWQVASDERLKTDIRSIDGALKKILNLRGVYYRWRNEETNRRDGEKVGLIAQEVEKVFPQAVKTTQLPPNSPAALASGTKVLSYSDLVAPIIQAIKELYTSCRSDHESIEGLQRENAAMRSYLCAHDPSAEFCASH